MDKMYLVWRCGRLDYYAKVDGDRITWHKKTEDATRMRYDLFRKIRGRLRGGKLTVEM